MKVLDKGAPFATDVEIGTGVIWLPYKNIHDIVTRALQDSCTEAFVDLEGCVRKYKPDFISFLNYKGPSTSDRELLTKAVADGLFLKGHEAKQTINPQLVNETMLLSDIFNINEFLALDLLATADTLRDDYPGWARGLIAVYLYYEGRLCMIQTVSTMVTALPGKTWHQDCFPTVFTSFKNVLEYVFKDDMMDSLLNLFEKSDTKTQLELLETNLALGDWRHRLEVSRMINGIREGIAFIVFANSAQKELHWKDTLRLMEHLKTCIRSDADFKIGKSEVLLLSAVMFSISNNLSLPDYNRSFAKELQKFLRDNEHKSPENNGFHCYEVFELIRLNYHILTHRAISETNISAIHGAESTNDIIKDDEDFYFKRDLFAFLRCQIFFDPENFTFEENIMKRFHAMFTDFISYMPMKVKEMKMRSEDAAKTANLYQNQGFLRPPNLPEDYENFLDCLGAFYSHDLLGLSYDFFDQDIRNLVLNKLVRGACIDSPTMFVPNCNLLCGLARGSPNEMFDVLKQNGHNFSFEHFFESILKYLSNFGGNQAGFNGPSLYTSEAFQSVVIDSMKVSINPAEISGICSYLDLVRTLSENSEKVRSYFSNQKLPWIRTSLQTAKVRAIPREIRAKMIHTAASMIARQCSHETVNNLWEMFYSIKLIGQENGDLKDELDEHETRLEMYPLTLSMLKLLDALIEARFKTDECAILELEGVGNLDNGTFDPYITYVRDNVLLKAFYRSYKSVYERWEVTTLAIEILSKLLDYVPQLMFQLLCGSSLLRTVLTTIVDCIRVREGSPGDIVPVDRCSYACLNLVRRALHRQGYYLHRREVSSSRQDSVIVGMQELLMKVISETGRPEFMLAILKYIDNLQPDTHQQAALDILALTLTDRDDIDAHLYAAVITDVNLISLIRHMFLNTLYDSPDHDEMKKSILQIIRASVVHSVPNFAMLLLGVDKKVDFQNAGVGGYPRTVLHAILDNAPNLPDAFATLLTLIRDPRLWDPLLRYLKTNHFFSNFIKEHFPSPTMTLEDIGNLLKCIAVELKTSPNPGPLAQAIIGDECGKFQEVLNMLELDAQTVEMPELEFFDSGNVMQAMKACEYFDSKHKIRIIRVDMLENMLKEEIAKLEKNTVLRLRHTVYGEAKDVVAFARQFNSNRIKEAAKINMFDGWRQCLEVLVLTPGTLNLAGVDFVTSILRILLIKAGGNSSPSEFFYRFASETVLTLSAVMETFKDQVNSTTLNVILGYICKWISEEQSPRVRATLYASILHVVKMFKDANEAGSACVNSFSLILDHLCKDCCQSPEIGKIQAMYLMGEIIRLTTARGLGGSDYWMEEELTFQQKDSFSQSSRNTTLQSINSPRLQKFDSPGRANSSFAANSSFPSNMTGAGDASINDSFLTANASMNVSKFSNVDSEKTYQSSSRFGSTKLGTGSGRAMDYLPTHLNIMTYMFAKGFLGNIVDAIVVMDDSDLAKLFSNQPIQNHMKSLYVFEAKLSLLCRFAATGRKAILLLMDVNIVYKLADMHVFEIRYYQDEVSNDMEVSSVAEQYNFSDAQSMTENQVEPTRKGIMQILFANALKLFHVMVDAAPKNVLLVEQIWHFLTVHDESLSNLINRQVITKDESSVGCTLLVSLLAKIAKNMPSTAFSSKSQIMTRVLEILKLQAVHPSDSDFRTSVIKDTIFFLYNYSNNREAIRQLKRKLETPAFRIVMKNKTNHDLLVESPEEDVTLGVVVKVISDIANMIIASHATGGLDSKKMEAATCILECGLTLIYLHVDVFLNAPAYRSSAQKFREEFTPLTDRLVKFITDAVKIVSRGDYIEMLSLRLRRMVHAK